MPLERWPEEGALGACPDCDEDVWFADGDWLHESGSVKCDDT